MNGSSRGFTLIELIVTISVLAILASIATPSFNALIQKNQLNTEVRELSSIIGQARSEAVLSKNTVKVQLNSNGTNTATELHWMPKHGINYTGSSTELTFTPEGTVSGFTANLDLSLCHPKLELEKTISITRMGSQLNKADGDCS